jgi:hypothetical protein
MLDRIETSPHRHHFIVQDIDKIMDYLRQDRHTMWHLDHYPDGGAEIIFFTDKNLNKFKEFLSENPTNTR